MKKFLVFAFVALTSGSAFAQSTLLGGPVTAAGGGASAPGPATSALQTLELGGAVTGSTINSATNFGPQISINVAPQINTSTQVNVSPAVAVGVAVAAAVGGSATATSIPTASTSNTQRTNQINFSGLSNALAQGVLY